MPSSCRDLRMRQALVILLVLTSSFLVPVPAPGAAEGPALRIAQVTVEPTAPVAGDVVTVHFQVVGLQETPVGGLQGRVLVLPVFGSSDGAATPIAEVRSAREVAPGIYELGVPLNEPGRWRIDIEATDGIDSAVSSSLLEVSPRLAAPLPSDAPLLLRASSWVTALRFDPRTGSIVRLLGETAVEAGGMTYVVRRSSFPVGTISRLYGGLWQLSLVLTDVHSGQELRIDLDPVRASLQPGSTSTPAMTMAVTGVSDKPVILVYRAARLGQSWLAEIIAIDSRSGEVRARQVLPGALRGTQLLPRVAVTSGSQLVVFERLLSLDASGEARVSILDAETLEVRMSRRWSFDAAAFADTDCLANPTIDGGALSTTQPRWFSWCRDSSSSWLGLWDLVTGQTIARIVADPTTTVLLPSHDGRWLFLVETRLRRVVALDADTGERREATRPASENEATTLWRRFSGLLLPDVQAASPLSLHAALSPDGRLLYTVFPSTDDLGDGIWVYETATLDPVEHLLPGWLVRGVVVASDGTVVALAEGSSGDRLVVLDNTEPRLIVTVPERISEVLQD